MKTDFGKRWGRILGAICLLTTLVASLSAVVSINGIVKASAAPAEPQITDPWVYWTGLDDIGPGELVAGFALTRNRSVQVLLVDGGEAAPYALKVLLIDPEMGLVVSQVELTQTDEKPARIDVGICERQIQVTVNWLGETPADSLAYFYTWQLYQDSEAPCSSLTQKSYIPLAARNTGGK